MDIPMSSLTAKHMNFRVTVIKKDPLGGDLIKLAMETDSRAEVEKFKSNISRSSLSNSEVYTANQNAILGKYNLID